ncbi:MAG: type 4 pilus major pilin [Candidatus Symbiodolus clandestinus]
MQFTTRCSRHRGFTALELIIVLVIGFSIIAVSASKMGELFLSSKITRATSSILELASSIRSLRGPEGYGADGPIIAQLKDNGLIPKTLRADANNQIKNEWDGTVTVEVDQAGSEVILTYPAIPKKACAKLATAILESGVFNSLSIDGGDPLTQSSNTRNMLTACSAGNAQNLEFTLTMGNS